MLSAYLGKLEEE